MVRDRLKVLKRSFGMPPNPPLLSPPPSDSTGEFEEGRSVREEGTSTGEKGGPENGEEGGLVGTQSNPLLLEANLAHCVGEEDESDMSDISSIHLFDFDS